MTGVSCEEILEEIRQDGRVDTQELEVSCDGGDVLLEGYLPSEAEHTILFEILEDRMGIQDVIDKIAISRLLERGDRAEGLAQDEELKKEEELHHHPRSG